MTESTGLLELFVPALDGRVRRNSLEGNGLRPSGGIPKAKEK
jgi:hypothetical protein